jgi:type VI secretion system protein ImpM
MPVSPVAPGWFGKTVALGDFAHRRLPLPVVQTLDEWLSQCVQQSRLALGDSWLTHYLNAPVWAFSLSPGVLEPHTPQGWVGVLMASCDAVGRYFPLVLLSAAGEDTPSDPAPCAVSAQAWYQRLAQVAIDTLAPNATVDTLEAALVALPSPPPVASVWQSDAVTHRLGQSLWWVQLPVPALGSHGVTVVCDGLPPPSRFGSMLQGRTL